MIGRSLAAFLLASALCSSAFSQSTPTGVNVTGSTPTTNNCTKFSGPNSVADAGAACGSGSGTVTSVATGTGLTGGTITTTGTLSLSPIAADNLLANSTGSSAAPIATALTSCSAATSAVTYNTTTHAFGCNTISSGSPGGTNTQVQYNNSSAFGGISNVTSNGTNLTKAVIATTAATAGFAVGPNGTTNPGINYDGSQASADTGLNIKSYASGSGLAGGLALSVIAPAATNEFLRIDAQGGGSIVLGNTSTGQITLTRNTVLSTATVNQAICTDGSKILGACASSGTGAFGDVSVLQTLKFNGHLLVSDGGSAPGVSACGTGAFVGNNTATAAFAMAVGTSPSTTCTITFPATARTGWHCNADDITTPSEVLHQTAYTTTSCTMTYYAITTGVATAPNASDLVLYTALAF